MTRPTRQIFNQANITNFVVDIPDNDRVSGFVLNAQAAPLPGVRIPIVDTVTGTMGLGRASRAGTSFEYDPFIVRFIIDEDMTSWLNMYKWMLSTNNYITGENTAQADGPEFATLHILDNSKTKIVLTANFYKPWVSDLSEIEFSYTEDADVAMVCTATIHYAYMTIEKDGEIIQTQQPKEYGTLSRPRHPSLR
ncbi:putative tail completion and sheath stabilizer protein [Escherichia phage vB_EcoM_ESCO47]|nr:putative tail completion and sheath stabilizer protein [Escherichia phage vB_EcoM_ESCO47]